MSEISVNMEPTKSKIAVFDFDGTLTTRDTMFDFIGFACGKFRLYVGLVLFAPVIAVMFMKIIDNNRCKQMLLSWYFKGMTYERFKNLGEAYSTRAKTLLRGSTLHLLKQRQYEGCKVYVVSASIKEWVAPVCRKLGVADVLATEFEVDADGILTGRFSVHNCFGQEKVNRLLKVEPCREKYYLYAYGDSRGDREMFEFADDFLKINR